MVEVKDLQIAYGQKTVVSGVSFHIEKGDYFCLVGGNGSGKTTIIKGILGLIPVKGGAVHLDVSSDKVSYVPQADKIAWDFPGTVFEIIMTGNQVKGQGCFYSKEDKKRGMEAMSLLGISLLMKKKVGEISGGEKQKVLLARALCKSPELIFLDEPFSGLDEKSAEDFYNLLEVMNKKGMTIVMVCHDHNIVKKYANRVAVLHNGLAFTGPVREWVDTYGY